MSQELLSMFLLLLMPHLELAMLIQNLFLSVLPLLAIASPGTQIVELIVLSQPALLVAAHLILISDSY